jgi:membrane peptidoglycan carboxypeptidase
VSQSRHEIRAAQLRGSRRGNGASRGRSGEAGGYGGTGGYGGSGGDDSQDSYTYRAGQLGSGSGGGRGDGGRGGGDSRGRRGEPERPRWKRWTLGILKWGSIAGVVLFVMGVIGAFVAYSKTSIPDANEMVDLQVSVIYYSDGKTELDRIAVADGNRESVKLSAVPKIVQEAHIAAEDRTFYQNNGISIGGILRAVKTSITGEAQVGGSTITQQYVKNYFLTQDRTLTRKAKEIMIAMKIDGEQSKDQILENYLNTIYYGRGAYGIQSGARAYFGKDVAKLSVAEAAVLASVINAPSYYDPANGEAAQANLERRVTYVLDGMVEEGWLSAADRAKITGLPKILPYTPNKFGAGPTGYITAEVRKELLANGLKESELEKGGLRIVTTIDKKAQANAVKSMKDNLPKGVAGGLVSVTPGDGAVVAMYGGADFAKDQFNVATQGALQAGSNFKPFAVLAAVRNGMSTKTKFNGDTPKEFKEYPHPVNNYDDVDYGMVDMRKMIGRSINTAFVALNQEVTPEKTRLAAIDAGIPEGTLGLKNDLGNVLGTSSPRVIDMASAYSTIASQGVRAKPYFVKSVTSTTDGGYTYAAKPKTQRAFDKDITADVTDAMTATVKKGGTATKIGREMPNRPVAGKTGTSEENKSKWFSGFVPQLATSVVIYKPDDNNNTSELSKAESQLPDGSTVPANIWLDYMKPTLDGVEVLPFPKRVGVGDDKVPTTTTTTTTTVPPTTTTTTLPPKSTAPGQTKEPGKPTKTAEPTLTTLTETTLVPTLTTTTTKPGNGGG